MQQGEEWTRLLAPKASEENGHEVYDHTMVVDLKQLSLKRFRKWDKAYMGNFAKVMSDSTPEGNFYVNLPPLFLGHFSPIFTRFFPILSPFSPSCRQDSGNRHQDPEKWSETVEKRRAKNPKLT